MCESICLYFLQIFTKTCPTFIFDASKKIQHHGHPGILFRIITGCLICCGLYGIMLLFFFFRFVVSKQGDSYNHLVNWLADARRRVFFFGVTRWVVGPDIKYIGYVGDEN